MTLTDTEAAHVEMMALKKFALHLIPLNLTNIIHICYFKFVITQKQKILRISYFDIR